MTMTNRYDPSKPEHRAICQRTKCAELPAHPGGRHLDQRDELYDGPGSMLQATSMYIRPSARKIISEAPELTPEVVDLVTYVEFLGQQVAHVSVDRDRQVREAMARSESCEHHGEEIKTLGDQVHHFDESYRRADAGRVALLGLTHMLDEVVRAHEAGTMKADITVAELIGALKGSLEAAHRQHARAWKQ